MTGEMDGKTCLVTGATHGIGEATAHALASMGATVLVHGRNPERGHRVVAEIGEKTGNRNVRFVQGDFTSLAEVRTLAAAVNAGTTKLDVLINNAGIGGPQRKLTTDGFELTFGVNHLAHFLLTNLLLDRLKASASARIVIVSSFVHFKAELDLSDLMTEKSYSFMRAYGRSKLANLLFMRDLSRRLDGDGVAVNALNPGMVNTQGDNQDFGLGMRLMASLMGPFMKSPKRGALTSVYLASSGEIEGNTGGYYSNCQPDKMSEQARDDAMAARLWQESAKLVGITG